jgi:DNA transformation protein and related proteins
MVVSMAASREWALELADRLHAMGPVTVTRFFGGAALRKDSVLFAFIIESILYMRVDDAGRDRFAALGASPFVYAGNKQSIKVSGYYEVPDDILDDPDEFTRWAEAAYRIALVAKKPGKERKSRKRGM